MKSLIIPIIAVLVMFQSCTPANQKLVADETAKKIFNPTELKGIEKMISFVDSIILYNTKATDINQAYHDYFDKLKSYVSEGPMIPALLKDTLKFKFMETLDEEAFDAIWRMNDYVRMAKYKDIILTDLHGFKMLDINLAGKYMIYLKETGKRDSSYIFIYNNIEAAGDISPSIVGWFLTNQQELDFNSFKNRLWATVFLFRLSDPFEEQVERYLKGKKLLSE
jgi:hypothetical protein